MNNSKPILIGNAYMDKTHGGYGYDVFHQDGICRCLNATSGGAAQTLVMIEHPVILATQRTEQAKQLRKINGDVGVKFSGSKEYTIREDNMSNTITTIQKDNLLLEPQSCAIRTRTYAGKPAALEMGGEVANALTSVQKDSMVAEPTIQRVGNIYPSKGQGGVVVDPNGISPAMCECHGEVTRVVIQKVGDRGTDNYSVHDYANTIPANPMSNRGQMVAEPQRTIAYKTMPNGNIRAYDPNTDDKRGISESQITNPNNESPTITSTQTPKIIMNQQVQYRIRKLTPVETGRLMGMDDADIHKMLDPVDDKGKPIISKSQAYKLHGNSIVVDVLYHIFRKMFINTESTQPQQLTLF